MFRPKASHGLWNPFILSLALGVSIHSPLDTASTLLSAYFSLTSLFIVIRIYNKCHPKTRKLSTKILDLLLDSHPQDVSQLPSDALAHCYKIPIFMPLFYLGAFYVYVQMEAKSNELILFTVLFLYAYPQLLSQLFLSYPKSFTFGEGAVVMQGIVIFTYRQFLDFIWHIEDETSRSGSIVITARMTLFIVMLWLLVASKCPSKFYMIGAALVCGLYLPYLWLRLRRNILVWIIQDVSTVSTLILLLSWVICVLAAIAYVQVYVKSQSNTIARKLFHLLASFVFLSGSIFNSYLLYLASMVVLGIFLLLEFIRLHRIKPLGPHLDRSFRQFLDEKDSGNLILTNIYLLVGLSIPLWLTESQNILINASGVLSIGIGDAAASAFGSKFGKIPWSSESKKTVEGSLASVLAQLCTMGMLLRDNNTLLTGLGISTLNALIEAFTDQVDNLVIPLAAHVITVLSLSRV